MIRQRATGFVTRHIYHRSDARSALLSVRFRTSSAMAPGRVEAKGFDHGLAETAYTPRNRALLSFGRAWVYRLVVVRLACPRVACTRWTGAPRSRAWLAWA